MAVLYIKEYSGLLMAAQSSAQFPEEPPVAEQTVAIGATHAESSALNAGTKYVRLCADVSCALSFGSVNAATASGTGTATGTSHRLPANVVEYIATDRLPAGGKISVIATT